MTDLRTCDASLVLAVHEGANAQPYLLLPVALSTHATVKSLTNQLTNHSADQSINQPINQMIIQATNQSIKNKFGTAT